VFPCPADLIIIAAAPGPAVDIAASPAALWPLHRPSAAPACL